MIAHMYYVFKKMDLGDSENTESRDSLCPRLEKLYRFILGHCPLHWMAEIHTNFNPLLSILN